MKRLLLCSVLFFKLIDASAQAQLLPATSVAGMLIKKEEGRYNDARYKGGSVQYAIVYFIDTAKHQLRQAYITTQRGGEQHHTVFNYAANQLQASMARVVRNGVVVYQQEYGYDADDLETGMQDLVVLASSDEKFALLNESKKYIAILERL